MAASAVRRYTGQGIKPAKLPELAKPDAVKLIPGTYVAGTLLGQFTTWTAANDVQTLTINYTPTGGSFVLAFNGVAMATAVAYNSTVAQTQAVIDAHPQIGAGQCVVSGGTLPGATQIFTFSGTLMKNLWQPLMTVFSNSLTGGTPGTTVVAHTTEGLSAGGAYGPYDDTKSNGLQVAKYILQKAAVVDTYGGIKVGGGEWQEVSFTADVWTCGYFRTADITGIDAAAVADLGRMDVGTTAALSAAGAIIAIF